MIKRKNTERKRGKSDTRTKSRELTVQPPVTIAFGIALEHWFWEWSFDEVHNVHLTNWSSQRSFINYSSSLVAVHSVNRAAFKTKLSIVDSVARRSVVRCTLGIPTNDLHIFFLLSYPFSCTFACDTRIATLWSCTVHDRTSRLLSVEQTTIASTWLRIPCPFSITVSVYGARDTREHSVASSLRRYFAMSRVYSFFDTRI